MDTIYTVYVFDSLNGNGFGHTITEHTRLTLPDGREAIESQWGTIRILDDSVKYATSMAGARQLVIDELHRRLAVIDDEVEKLRSQGVEQEVEVQNG